MNEIYTLDQIAKQLTDDGWPFFGETRQTWDKKVGDTITVNYSALNANSEILAAEALKLLSSMIGINFVVTTGAADITFNHGGAADVNNAFSTATTQGRSDGTSQIISAVITIGTGFLAASPNDVVGGVVNYNNYNFGTFLHEIGHALGLAHGGDYNGNANYATDRKYLNDSYQATMMSYFSQLDNTNINATNVNYITPMIADIIALQDLYGTPSNVHAGNTVYGLNSTAGDVLDSLARLNHQATFTILDTSGTDKVDYSNFNVDQKLDLNGEGISDVAGLKGNMVIARGTILENGETGNGDDTIIGNYVANDIRSNGGNDKIINAQGDNSLFAGSGSDDVLVFTGNNTVEGGTGSDFLRGGMNSDTLKGGDDQDVLRGDPTSGFFYGQDTLDGGKGNDLMMGGKGADVFVFRPNEGADTIGAFVAGDVTKDLLNQYQFTGTLTKDFEVGVDKIAFINGFPGVTPQNALNFFADVNGNATFSSQGTTITLIGVKTSELSMSDFSIFTEPSTSTITVGPITVVNTANESIRHAEFIQDDFLFL